MTLSTPELASINDGLMDKLAAQAKALADPVRLRLFAEIATAANGESCVCDLVEGSDRSQATVSHHLRLLREAGLISGDRRGTWVWYRADPMALGELRDWLTGLSRPPAEPVAEIHKCDGEACCS